MLSIQPPFSNPNNAKERLNKHGLAILFIYSSVILSGLWYLSPSLGLRSSLNLSSLPASLSLSISNLQGLDTCMEKEVHWSGFMSRN